MTLDDHSCCLECRLVPAHDYRCYACGLLYHLHDMNPDMTAYLRWRRQLEERGIRFACAQCFKEQHE